MFIAYLPAVAKPPSTSVAPRDALYPLTAGRRPRQYTLDLCRAFYLRGGHRRDARQRRTVSPSRSSSGMRPLMRSATMRAVPHAIVQPMWPCPEFRKRLRWRPRPRTGGPSGVMGRRHVGVGAHRAVARLHAVDAIRARAQRGDPRAELHREAVLVPRDPRQALREYARVAAGVAEVADGTGDLVLHRLEDGIQARHRAGV